ncbi:Lipopolysaccharide heptosyltransferase 1 [Achromobacter xylosoxidans]|jgi:heptosyltransferase-1|nr:Lipopolysaccharide heptosyltransferase 1 [Achromobacter xylosoxidans]CUI93875.1 Lipopolysaccharide heptosyltransferase 1 [Achromobacter xylosoxidans]CUK00344.1 Lipopolysaccharide heptosyltransferase 1 [Achromobacter xylosoxidans]
MVTIPPSMRILIVRTSSLGDLVHMLPAISDIVRHVPGAEIDWIVEEAFAEIPAWHPGVKNIIKVAHRRWRKAWWSKDVRAERKALAQRLRETEYDIVLDMQGLLKSAWLVRQAKGIRHGLDWRSAREPLASLFYNIRHRVEFWQPAVVRQRKLAAQTFSYTYGGHPDFGLQTFLRRTAALQENGAQAEQEIEVELGLPIETSRAHHLGVDEKYAVIMPSASRDDKLWPEDDWRAVFRKLRDAGCTLKLLAGNEQEAQRAQLLVAGMEGVEVMPRMGLTAVGRLLAGASLMVGLDSGLTHLSAALGRPTIGIYRASTPVRTPLVGSNYTASLGDRGASPSREAVLAAVDQALAAT